MSLERTAMLNCPDCNHAQEVVVWSSLNAQVSPQAANDFFAGKINVFQCESCGTQAHLGVPFMYHDMTLRFCVQYYPAEAMDDEKTLATYNLDGSATTEIFGPTKPPPEFLEKAAYMLHAHIVFSMQEALLYVIFREKLAAFHASR